MKALGIPLTEDTIACRGYCFGICINEEGKYLGQWTSSNYSFLESDLKTHAKGYDYKFVPMPNYDELVHIAVMLAKYQESLK